MIKKKTDLTHITGSPTLLPEDRIHTFLLCDGMLRGAIIRSTILTNEMRENHSLGIIETLALGHAYAVCGLLTSDMKGTEKVVIQIDCAGPLKGLLVEANARGDIRGYLKSTDFEKPDHLESFDLSPFFGPGFLSVTKYLARSAKPFTGQVELKYGTLAEDLAWYYLTSEQIPSAFHLSVMFDKQGNVTGAGGLALHSMPGADSGVIDAVLEKFNNLPSLGEMFAAQTLPRELLFDYFEDFKPEIISSRPCRFYCSCSKKRFSSYIAALPQTDLVDILNNDPLPMKITCHNCATEYEFYKPELEKMIKT